jgi:hypothetical protein
VVGFLKKASGDLYYPYSFLLGFMLVFIAKQVLKIYCIVNGEVDLFGVISFAMTFLFLMEMEYYSLFFISIRSPTMNTKGWKVLKSAMWISWSVLPVILVILVSSAPQFSRIPSFIEPYSKRFFIGLYNIDIPEIILPFILISSAFFVANLFSFWRMVSLNVGILLKASYVFIQILFLFTIFLIGCDEGWLRFIPESIVWVTETLKLACISCLSISLLRNSDNV